MIISRYPKTRTFIISCLIILSVSFLSCTDRGDSSLESGKETYFTGDYEKASKILGVSILHLNEEKKKLKTSGRYDNKTLDRIEAKIEKSADAFFYRGMSYKNMEMWAEAIKDFSVTLNMNSDYTKAISERAICFYELGFSKRSIEDLDIAIKMDPNNPTFFSNRASINLKLRNYENAVLDASKAISMDSHFANSYYVRAEAYKFLKNYQKAINDYKKSIKLLSNGSHLYEIYLSMGKCYYHISKKEKAEESYKTALKYDEKPYLAYLNLAILYGGEASPNSEEMDKAIEFCIKSSELSDLKEDKPLTYLASLYFKREDYQKAYEIQKLAKDLNQYDEEINEWLDIYDNKRKINTD